MKLYWSSRSPYVRKVMVVAHELGLAERIETEPTLVSAYNPNREMFAVNPLAKLPTLITDEGGALFDSRVICEYLDSLGEAGSLFPEDHAERWRALRWQALGDGILDMQLQRLGEERSRSDEQRSPELLSGIALKTTACLDALEAEATDLEAARLCIGHIAVGCALGYLDFRFPGDAWRDGRRELARWYEGFARRPSMRATEPVDA